MSKNKYSINGENFNSQKELMDKIKTILYENNLNSPISENDFKFVISLLQNHPKKELKIGCGIKSINVKINEVFKRNREFIIIRNDNSVVNFSYKECISPKNHKTKVLQAMRFAILDQIKNVKSEFFKDCDEKLCSITGEIITMFNCHVDHIKPNTFENLVKNWIDCKNLKFDKIEIEKFSDGDNVIFTDKNLNDDWKNYHRENAKLQVVSQTANLSTLKRL